MKIGTTDDGRRMRSLLVMIYMLVCLIGRPVYAQTVDPLSQYQQAVQLRMDDLVRKTTYDFFSKSHLAPPVIEQVVATPKFNIDQDSARIASLDLRVVLVSDHPPEVVRQLRQYLGQSLGREGFVIDHFAEPGTGAPHLTLTLDVRAAPSVFMRFDLPGYWREYAVFGMIMIAFCSAVVFGGYLIMLPFAARRRTKDIVARAAAARSAPSPETTSEAGLPPLPAADSSIAPELSVLPSLDIMLAREKERQHFPVWLADSGARMSNVQSIRKAFEVLPFDEAIDMLSCLEEEDRSLVLRSLNLNPSVRERIRREIAARTPVLST